MKFDGEICGGVLVENASDDFPQRKKLKNLLPNFAGSSLPILPKTSPTLRIFSGYLLLTECSSRPGLLTPGLFLQTRLLWHNASETFLGSREGVYEQEGELPNGKRCNCMGDDPDWAPYVCQVPAGTECVPPSS